MGMDLLKEILSELEGLKLRDRVVYNAGGKSILADYFIVVSSDSTVQMEAARQKLIALLKGGHKKLKNPLEEWQGGWCLLDFGDIIIHIMLDEMRSFYNLDGLFQGAGYQLEKKSA
jgi:ribosome-associated protein